MVKEYSFEKVGIDVADQKLRSKLAYANSICCKGWSRKWAMHAVQQIWHNAFMVWKDIHKIETGNNLEAKEWSKDGCGTGKAQWVFQIGLIKGLLARIRQYKRANDDRDKQRYSDDANAPVHTIVNRGDIYKNV